MPVNDLILRGIVAFFFVGGAVLLFGTIANAILCETRLFWKDWRNKCEWVLRGESDWSPLAFLAVSLISFPAWLIACGLDRLSAMGSAIAVFALSKIVPTPQSTTDDVLGFVDAEIRITKAFLEKNKN